MFLFGARRAAVYGTAAMAPAFMSAALIALIGGCDLGPAAVPIPQFSASGAASEAMTEYDANKDGALDQEELKKVPGLLHYPQKFDANGDKKVDAAELNKRLGEIYGQQVGLIGYPLTILHNGKPLAGAKVRMIPEKFMGAAIKPAEGTTGTDGGASMSVAPSELPPEIPPGRLRAVHYGIYKVEVTHASLPEGTGAALGLQVATDVMLEPAKLDLKPQK